jgi:hypothetical protein
MLKISLGGVGGCNLAAALRRLDQPAYPYDWIYSNQSFVLRSFNDFNAFFTFDPKYVYDRTKLLDKDKGGILLHDFTDFCEHSNAVIERYKRRFARLKDALESRTPILFIRVGDDLKKPLSPLHYYDEIFVREEESICAYSELMTKLSALFNKKCSILYISSATNSDSPTYQNVIVKTVPDPHNHELLFSIISEVETELWHM